MKNELLIDFNDPKFIADKYGVIEKLRQQSFYARTPNNEVVFFNQQDVMHIMRCNDFRFSFFQITPDKSAYLSKSIEHELLNKHGTDHRRLQKLVMRALKDKVVDGFKDKIYKIVNDLIDALPEKAPFDFCEHFSEPFPALVMGPLLGVPYGDIPEFNEWIKVGGRKVDAIRTGDGIKEVEAANRNMHDYLRAMLQHRRQNLNKDVFSELILAEIDGDRLTEVELVSLAGELASAGVDTTRAQVPLTMAALLEHPQQLALLKENPSLASAVVEEGMRFAPLPFALPHAALHDYTYKGIHFKKGDIALAMVLGANRDPAAMEDAHTFNIQREKARHFSFGYGPHFCTGSQIARMEMSIVFEMLAKRIKSWRLVETPVRAPITKGAFPKKLLVEITKE